MAICGVPASERFVERAPLAVAVIDPERQCGLAVGNSLIEKRQLPGRDLFPEIPLSLLFEDRIRLNGDNGIAFPQVMPGVLPSVKPDIEYQIVLYHDILLTAGIATTTSA